AAPIDAAVVAPAVVAPAAVVGTGHTLPVGVRVVAWAATAKDLNHVGLGLRRWSGRKCVGVAGHETGSQSGDHGELGKRLSHGSFLLNSATVVCLSRPDRIPFDHRPRPRFSQTAALGSKMLGRSRCAPGGTRRYRWQHAGAAQCRPVSASVTLSLWPRIRCRMPRAARSANYSAWKTPPASRPGTLARLSQLRREIANPLIAED